MKTELVQIPELAAMGVARLSIPVASLLVMHKAAHRAGAPVEHMSRPRNR